MIRPDRPPRTPLGELVSWLGARADVTTGGVSPAAVVVTGCTLASSRVRPGDLYAALPGARAHGIDFAADAVAAGAVAVLTDPAGAERAGDLGTEVPVLVVDAPRRVLGALAAHVYGDPAASMRMIGVTGTQGKTTTTRLAEGALHRAGVRAGVIGTVGTRIAGEEVATSLTTPEAPDLQALFAVMRERGVQVCLMEVSSHALVLGRVDGIVFDVAVFLNLGRDHLDFHASVEDYYAAKASLFTPGRARLALVDVDDEHGRRLAAETDLPVRTLSLHDTTAQWTVADVVAGPDRSDFRVRGPGPVDVTAGVPLPGDFNVANALAAIAACAEAGQPVRDVAAAMAHGPGVPGRLERVDAGQDFTAIVDYAHKPDAVRAALSTLRPLTPGRVIAVLGAGGDRDPGKRPLMGEVAARLADVLVVTDDNPRSEAPAAIRAAVLAGAHEVAAEQRAELHEVAGRRDAIGLALGLAGAGDIVLVAGKGHETGQEIEGTVHPFDDRVVVREVLTARRGGAPPEQR